MKEFLIHVRDVFWCGLSTIEPSAWAVKTSLYNYRSDINVGTNRCPRNTHIHIHISGALRNDCFPCNVEAVLITLDSYYDLDT